MHLFETHKNTHVCSTSTADATGVRVVVGLTRARRFGNTHTHIHTRYSQNRHARSWRAFSAHVSHTQPFTTSTTSNRSQHVHTVIQYTLYYYANQLHPNTHRSLERMPHGHRIARTLGHRRPMLRGRRARRRPAAAQYQRAEHDLLAQLRFGGDRRADGNVLQVVRTGQRHAQLAVVGIPSHRQRRRKLVGLPCVGQNVVPIDGRLDVHGAAVVHVLELLLALDRAAHLGGGDAQTEALLWLLAASAAAAAAADRQAAPHVAQRPAIGGAVGRADLWLFSHRGALLRCDWRRLAGRIGRGDVQVTDLQDNLHLALRMRGDLCGTNERANAKV